jgi:dGTPase
MLVADACFAGALSRRWLTDQHRHRAYSEVMNHPLADSSWTDPTVISERSRAWANTMAGHQSAPGDARLAHADTHVELDHQSPIMRQEREEYEAAHLVRGATLSNGAGSRSVDEAPDPVRTCFERDRDRILHSSAYRRLAGKTQVFVTPTDHQRTRMTHAIEVAQVARSIAQALRLNVALAEAIAIGHDCGHGPGGHASEDALSPYLEGGYDHAVWGADVVLAPLNLCLQTIDGIRNHSWSRPAPMTPEGEVVSWADRIAYVCHDFEDAVSAGIITADVLPVDVVQQCGVTRSDQLNAFIRAVVGCASNTGRIGMDEDMAEALASFRRCNYERIYLRPASVAQAQQVVAVLRGLTDHFIDRPNLIPDVQRAGGAAAGTPEAVRAAVTYVGGMTDRFAFGQAVALLDWDRRSLPQPI